MIQFYGEVKKEQHRRPEKVHSKWCNVQGAMEKFQIRADVCRQPILLSVK